MFADWIAEGGQIVSELIGATGSATEYNVLLGVAIVGLLFALFNISAAMGSTMATPLRVLAVTVIGGALVIGAAVLTRVHLVPSLHSAPMLPWLPLIVAGLATLLTCGPAGQMDSFVGLFRGGVCTRAERGRRSPRGGYDTRRFQRLPRGG